MEMTYCPCKNGKRNNNCFPGDLVKCCKNTNNNCRQLVNDVHKMGLTFLNCKRDNDCCEKSLEHCAHITKIGTLDYGSKCENHCHDTSINNVCYINNNRLLVCGSETKYPLWSYCVDSCRGIVSSEPQYWNIFINKKLSFVGKLFDGFAVIPKNSFQLIYFRENECEYKKVKFEGCNSFSEKMIRTILDYECFSGANRKENFKFAGFFVKHNHVYFAVELSSDRKEKVKKLYILRSSFRCGCHSLADDLCIVGVHDLYKLYKCHDICKEEISKLSVTSLSHRNNEIFFMTSSKSEGYLWNCAVPIEPICKKSCEDGKLHLVHGKKDKLCLEKKPRGLTFLCNSEILVICDHNKCNKKCENNYYLLNL